MDQILIKLITAKDNTMQIQFYIFWLKSALNRKVFYFIAKNAELTSTLVISMMCTLYKKKVKKKSELFCGVELVNMQPELSFYKAIALLSP